MSRLPTTLPALDLARARSLCAARGVSWPVEYHASIGSTQDRARELALAGAPETVVFAEQQKKGRGQRGRSWYSPAGGGNWLTLLVRPAIPADRYPLLTLAAGVAIAEAVEEVTGAAAQIKWPNDVLVAGKKCAGILAESDASSGWAILGIGVDVCAELPPELADHAISLQQVVRPLPPSPSPTSGEGGEPQPHPLPDFGEGSIEREVVLAAELAAVQRWLARLRTEAEAVIAAVVARDALRGQPVTIDTPAGRTEGIARGIDHRGALLVETRGGTVIPCFAGIAQLRKDGDG